MPGLLARFLKSFKIVCRIGAWCSDGHTINEFVKPSNSKNHTFSTPLVLSKSSIFVIDSLSMCSDRYEIMCSSLVVCRKSFPKYVKFSIEFGMFASMTCVYEIPLILYAEWKFGHFGMLYMNANIEAHRSRNFNVSCRNSAGRNEFSSSEWLKLPLPPDISKYDRRHKIQSSPALAKTRVLSLSRNTRKISLMFAMFNGRFRAFLNVPKSGRHPERISVRWASTISYKHATIWSWNLEFSLFVTSLATLQHSRAELSVCLVYLYINIACFHAQ